MNGMLMSDIRVNFCAVFELSDTTTAHTVASLLTSELAGLEDKVEDCQNFSVLYGNCAQFMHADNVQFLQVN